jgi:enoyl-CoA hydratase/carnithine racemase
MVALVGAAVDDAVEDAEVKVAVFAGNGTVELPLTTEAVV